MNTILSNKKYNYKHHNYYLTKQQCNNIFTGAKHCYDFGYPLNRHFIILLEQFGFDANKYDVVDFRKTFFDKISKWLSYREIPVAYIYVWEVGKIKGLHLHFIIHIPFGVQKSFKKYVKKILNEYEIDTTEYKQKSKAIKSSNISYGAFNNDLEYINNICSYISKGSNPRDSITDLYGEIVQKPIHQGRLPFQRMGMSKQLHKNI